MKLPHPHSEKYKGGHKAKHQRADKPAEIGQRKEKGSLSAVEMAAGHNTHARDTQGKPVAFRDIGRVKGRSGTQQNCRIIEQTIRP